MLPQLDLIDLDQPALEGYRRFVSCWLSRGEGPAFLVDPGPTSTAPRLIERLRALGVARLDFILLTHIHLDHAGGTALLVDAFPDARVFCHQNGRQHLVEPARLWEGSRAVLGEVADHFGAPRPVPDRAFASQADLTSAGIAVVPTPGHAPHHLSFLHEGTLFAGEAAGTYLELARGLWYLRPATPPRFFLETALASLDRMVALTPEPARLAFAHHGLHEGRVRDLLRLAGEQLAQWVQAVRHALAEAPRAEFAALRETVVARLAAADPHFALRAELPPDIRAREEAFTTQTLRGMVQYVAECAGR
ncbi:MAG TPA: MBL fold metallo-hydrolase [Candidatus Krumholzibacteria bacterium]|nr:MBL fold metallo-hydrolase [Candidatus Krumholzibacteria bacterium]HPD71979.1 MBL fold metallo-hydrolase [Candidatus Krumholzibacteria bacterium]HRY41088.1 MBL fold metallo-hydrolase [Candidatus Krumholzibacteria bacterium]